MNQTQERRWIRRFAVGIAILAAAGTVSALVWRATAQRGAGARREVASQLPALADRHGESRIAAFCGDCHGVPAPDRFPRDAWYGKVKRGYEFYAESGRNDLDPPPLDLTVAYYRSRAGEHVVYPESPEAPQPLRVSFRVQRFLSPPTSPIAPCLANLRWTSLQPQSLPVLLACDMRTGTVRAVDVRDASRVPRVLAVLNNPCHVEPCDLDGDGSRDLVVADLGSQLADDHDRGQVVWLRSDPATGDYQKVIIAAGLGRVADAQPADVDGDGDQDLIVAEFGMYRTGGMQLPHWLAVWWNQGPAR